MVKPDNRHISYLLAPGRYDKPPKAVAGMMDRFAHIDVIGVTEYQDKPRRKALQREGRTLLHGAGHSGLRELALSIRDDLGEITDWGCPEVTQTTYVRVGGATAPPKGMLWADILLPNGKTLTVAVMHLTNTKGNMRFESKSPARDKSYREQVTGSSRRLKNKRNVMLGADFNARLGVPNEMRTFLDSNYKGAGMHRIRGFNGISGFYGKGVKVIETGSRQMIGVSDHPGEIIRFKVR